MQVVRGHLLRRCFADRITGPADFDEAAKIKALDAYITANIALSYSWPGYQKKADALAKVRQQLSDKLLYAQLFSNATQFGEL